MRHALPTMAALALLSAGCAAQPAAPPGAPPKAAVGELDRYLPLENDTVPVLERAGWETRRAAESVLFVR